MCLSEKEHKLKKNGGGRLKAPAAVVDIPNIWQKEHGKLYAPLAVS